MALLMHGAKLLSAFRIVFIYVCIYVSVYVISPSPPVTLVSEMWKDPSSFMPERFLSDDGAELNKMEGEKVLIFGMGKRRCIGEAIGRAEVFLFLAILVQHLQFHKMPDQELDMTPEYGLTMKHKRCHLRATDRKSVV